MQEESIYAKINLNIRVVGVKMSRIVITADKLRKRKKTSKIARIIVLILLILFSFAYIILGIIYNGGRFTITLDPSFALESGIVLYENKEIKDKKNKLYASEIDFMDNISVKWIDPNVDNAGDGAHNGENYIAYTFYLENEGKETLNYWMECTIDDVIRNVDEAVRIMIFQNGQPTIYAKENSLTKEPEPDTEKFYSSTLPVLRERKDFTPGSVDKYTIVIWLEGDDPDCVDALIGGEIKMHMDIREEHIEQEKDKK